MTLLIDSFVKQSQALTDLLEQEGLAVRPFASNKLPYFSALEEPLQEEVVTSLTNYVEVARRAIADGGSLKDNVDFVQKALTYYDLEAHPEFTNRMTSASGVVEFYTVHSTQFFRTFNFFEVTSYTVEDIYCRQWVHLYERPKDVIEEMFQRVGELVTKKDITKVAFIEHPHILKERVSLEKLELQFESIHITPLHRKGEFLGLASIVSYKP